jgi:hypothetical protein
VKRSLYARVSFVLAASAIFLVGMLRDPDLANADDLDTAPVAHERMPGYQCMTDGDKAATLTEAETAKRNASPDGPVPTF